MLHHFENFSASLYPLLTAEKTIKGGIELNKDHNHHKKEGSRAEEKKEKKPRRGLEKIAR